MKKIFALLSLVLICVSCLPDDSDYPRYHLELVPIESVEIPEFFIHGETYDIKLFYKKLSTCHYPNRIYYQSEFNSRTIAVENVVYHRDDCSTDIPEEDLIQQMSFEFWVTQLTGTVYTFKFYQGREENGTPIYLIVEVPVKELEEED